MNNTQKQSRGFWQRAAAVLDIVQAKKKVSDPNLLLKEFFELAKETVVVQEKDKIEATARNEEVMGEEDEETGSLLEDLEMVRRLIFATVNFHCKRLAVESDQEK